VVGVLIELDTGHHRTGVRTVRAAARLASTARRLANVRLAGVYTHEGHVYKASPERIPEVCAEAADALRTAAAECETEFVSVGSTPGAVSMAGEHAVSELRPGNYVYLDATQVSLGAAAERCALTVLTTVISRPTAVDAFLDVGTKGLSGDRTPDGRCGFILGHPEAVVDWCNEEHAHLRLDATDLAPVVGDRLRVVPAHACACVNCHDRAWLLRGDEIIETWPVSARGRMT
jgi:D-serine deaminase-like pyridoxal phosphate-dependent protein